MDNQDANSRQTVFGSYKEAHGPAGLFAVKEDIMASRERKQIGAQILPAAASHARSFCKLSGLRLTD